VSHVLTVEKFLLTSLATAPSARTAAASSTPIDTCLASGAAVGRLELARWHAAVRTRLTYMQSDVWRLHSKSMAVECRAKTTIGAAQHGAEQP